MAETPGAINGTLIKLYKDVAGTLKPIANLVSDDFNIDKTMIEVTSKSSGAGSEFITGRYTWSCSAESITEYDTSVGSGEMSLQDILTDLLAGTSWSVVIGTGTTGDLKLSGTAYISNVAGSNPDNDKSTFTCDFQGTGVLTVGTFA
jgi:predicted secreted protein